MAVENKTSTLAELAETSDLDRTFTETESGAMPEVAT